MVEDDPDLELGDLRGPREATFFQVQGAVLLSDRQLIVANGGSNELLWFDSTGAFLRATGRTGDGPGEFRVLDTLLYVPGDTVAAWDFRLRRMTFFDSKGVRAREFHLDAAGSGAPQPVSVLRGGRVLFESVIPVFQTLGVGDLAPDTVTFFLTDSQGNHLRDVGTLPSTDFFGYQNGSYPWIGPTYPVAKAMATGWGDQIFFGRGQDNWWVAASSKGVWQAARRPPWDRRGVTDQAYQAYIDHRVDDAPDGADQAQWRRNFEGRPHGEWYPGYSALMADQLGYLWVRRYQEPWEEREQWAVFDPEGVLLCDVVGPPGGRLLQAGPESVVSVRVDDFGIEYIAVHSLRRTGGRGPER